MRARLSTKRLSPAPDAHVATTSAVATRLRTNLVAFDTEGTGLVSYGPPAYWGYWPARPFAFSFCDSEGNTAYIRWAVDPRTRQVILGPQHEQDALAFFLASPNYTKIGHNIAYDLRMCKALGFTVNGQIHDTMVLAHVVTAGDELTYALKPLSKKYLHFPDDDEKELEDAVKTARTWARAQGYLIAGGKKEVAKGERVVFAGNKPVKADYWLAPPDLCQRYAVGDVERAMLLFLLWWEELQGNPRLMSTYRREMHLFHVLRKMEMRGTRVYPNHAMHLINWYNEYADQMRELGNANDGYIDGKAMNYRSPKQLMKKFYDERKYTVMYKERKNKKTGETKTTPSLGKDELAIWGSTDEETGEAKDTLAKAILEWRAAKQTIAAFLNIYTKFWYPESHSLLPAHVDDRQNVALSAGLDWSQQYDEGVWVLHPNYNQTGAVTGRMTCSDPNLQQVASATTGLRKSEIPQRPRECFGPRPNCVWYLPDYSQIEVWLFAFMSGTQNMMNLLMSGYDFHQGVADKSFVKKSDYKYRKKYYRKLAKLIMFGKLYGGGVGTAERPGRMTKLLQMPFEEAKEFIDSFDEEFEEVVIYMKAMVKEAKHVGEMYNPYGRLYRMEKNWAYKIVNYMVQGTAAEVLKVATIRLDWFLETSKWAHPQLGLINSIHDEMMIEVPKARHCKQLMREIMWVMQMDSGPLGLPVPLPVGMKMTKPLYSMRERKHVQRWSDTMDVAVRSPQTLQYWAKRGKVDPGDTPEKKKENEEKFVSMLGGVPYLPSEEEKFTYVKAHMAKCPYNEDIDIERVVAA